MRKISKEFLDSELKEETRIWTVVELMDQGRRDGWFVKGVARVTIHDATVDGGSVEGTCWAPVVTRKHLLEGAGTNHCTIS